jgi:Ca2+/Na+ antiporter
MQISLFNISEMFIFQVTNILMQIKSIEVPAVLYQLYMLFAINLGWLTFPLALFVWWNFKRKKSKKIQKQNSEISNKLTIGRNQKFIKAHYVAKGSKFTSSGYCCDFKVYFSKETFCFNAKGFATSIDGQLYPKVSESWCESHNRPLQDKEIELFFKYIIEHDEDFMKKLELCK